MKKLLMPGTSHGTRFILKYAKSQGVYTIVTDYREPEHSPGELIADEYRMISTGDPDMLEKECRKENFEYLRRVYQEGTEGKSA